MLQSQVEAAAGFVEPYVYHQKAKHRQLAQVLCR